MSDEVRAAVHAELQRFAQHMRDTALNGVAMDAWIRDGLQWYIDGGNGE